MTTRRYLAALAAATVIVCAAQDASAQLSCDNAGRSNDIWQVGTQAKVRVNATTERAQGPCFHEVQVEAWLEEMPVSGVHMHRHPTNAVANWDQTAYIAYNHLTQSTGKHWLIRNGVDWDFVGYTHDEVVPAPPPTGGGGGGGGEEGPCIAELRLMPPGLILPDPCGESPVLVDMQGDGYRLTNLENGVRFDLDADGTPEWVAWTEAESDDAWLALDRDGNGTIDSGKELFGNHTPVYEDRVDLHAVDGFDALAFLEGPDYGPSRVDGVITSNDTVWNRLVLWTDRNHNGISEPDELRPVSATKLRSIGTQADGSTPFVDANGNVFRLRAVSQWLATQGRLTPRYVYDVWLQHEAGPPTR